MSSGGLAKIFTFWFPVRKENAPTVFGAKSTNQVESFNGRLRDEFLNETLFTSLIQARLALEEWRRDYNTVRSHSRIGWLAPAVYAAQFSPQPGQGACHSLKHTQRRRRDVFHCAQPIIKFGSPGKIRP